MTRADASTPLGSPSGLTSQRAGVRTPSYLPNDSTHQLSQQVDRTTGAAQGHNAPASRPRARALRVEIVVAFDDVGPQPIILQAYELRVDEGVEPGHEVTALSEGSRLTVCRR